MLKSLLDPLGVSAEEAALYLKLLEAGALPAGRLAQRCDVPRSSLYGMLDRLVEKGMVKWDEGAGGTRLYHAVSPTILKDMLAQRRMALEEAEKNLTTIMPQLQNKARGKNNDPRFTVYKGKAQMQNILSDMMMDDRNVNYTFWPIRLMMDVLGEDYFFKSNVARIKKRIYIQAIWPEKQTVDVNKHPFMGCGAGYCREIRIAPPSVDTRMGYWIYGNQVAVLSSIEECFGFVVESQEFAEMMKTQHRVMWEQSRPMPCAGKAVDEFLAKYGDKREMKEKSSL